MWCSGCSRGGRCILVANTAGRQRRRRVLAVRILGQRLVTQHNESNDKNGRSDVEANNDRGIFNVSFSREQADLMERIRHHYGVSNDEVVGILLKVGLEVLSRQVQDEIHKHLVDVSRTESSGTWEKFVLFDPDDAED